MKRLLSSVVLTGFFFTLSVAWSAPDTYSTQKSTKKKSAKKKAPKKVSAKALADAETSYSKHLTEAAKSSKRPAADRKRDKHRKPVQVLEYIGIKPGMRVVEMMAGRGYYTELLSRAVGPKGKVWAHNNKFVNKRFADKALKKRLAGKRLPNVVRLNTELEDPKLPKNLDVVVMILFYHDTYWMKANRAKMNKAILKALKPGGLFVVIDHHAEQGAGSSQVKKLHRIEASLVKSEVLKAGFVLNGSSGLLRNFQDDRKVNVFKSSIRGRTDRFIFAFRRPKASSKKAEDKGKTTEVIKLSRKVYPAKKKKGKKAPKKPAKKKDTKKKETKKEEKAEDKKEGKKI